MPRQHIYHIFFPILGRLLAFLVIETNMETTRQCGISHQGNSESTASSVILNYVHDTAT